jgi:flagellar basal body-associated protein FliL
LDPWIIIVVVVVVVVIVVVVVVVIVIIKIYNRLPLSIKAHSNNIKRFKAALKRYLLEHVLYSLDEYYQIQ